jgi:ribonuclease HII
MKVKYLKPKFEKEFLKTYSRVVGIDEVGRGSWAGPVAVGAFIYDSNCKLVKGVNDSKLVAGNQRKELFKPLSKYEYRVNFGEVEVINKIGIGKTIENIITNIVDELNDGKTFFIIDGQFSKNFGEHTMKAIKADSTYYCVGAASILAKVIRDNFMMEIHNNYPDYDFYKNKGYPSPFHRNALREKGFCEIHRKSFAPIREMVEYQLSLI